MTKTGCLYAAGLTLIGIWLLTFLLQTPTVSQRTATSATPTPMPVANTPVTAPSQSPGIAAQQSAPEPSVPILRATRVRSPAEEARIKKYVPARVKMRQDVEFLAINQNATMPSVYGGQGKEVTVVRVTGSDLVVEYGGWRATVPTWKTDFLERVIAEAEK
jgi:hypothetical protein